MLLQLLYIILLSSSVLSYEQVCNHKDQSSLLSFSANISTSSPYPPLNWSSSISCCHWEGVDCNVNGRVIHLQLHSRGLQGKITPSISNLVRLTHLNLFENHLHGKLRDAIVGLTNLEVIDLSSNYIHDSIPREIGTLFYLKKLHLYDNELHGPIPSSLMNCSKLEEIILRINLLNGDISKLDFSRLLHLQKLDLAINMLEGIIPESIYSCKSLIAFRVAKNNISGQISPRIAGLKSLSFVSIGINYFSNIKRALQALAKCKNLTILILSSNFYGEPLPTHRNFIGLNGFSKLQYLGLSGCDSGGPIPNWLSNLKKLRILTLNGNKMRGIIPYWLVMFPNLVQLQLSENNFSGEFPLQLCQLPSFISQNFDPNLNYFLFDLPVIIVKSGQNYISWSNFIAFKVALSLANNNFTGNIPPQIGNMHNLQILNLKNNNFYGHIPVGISNLKMLEVLDLSRNSLTGEITASLERLNFLSNFNVAYNNLEGPIPIGGQFSTFEEYEFIGNLRLCGEQINRPCNNNASKQNTTVIDGDVRHDRMASFVNGLIVGSAFGFSSVLAIVATYVWFKICKGCQPSSIRG